ncbi:MAG: Mur ligase family protein [Acidobacteriota bacterium]|nr:Mur ligase family protein [Acidobacteriota bacterium]
MSLPLAALAASYEIRGDADLEITGLTEDSRTVEPGSMFVAISGTSDDGHKYIDDAIARGATAIAAQQIAHVPAGVTAVQVPSARQALAVMAARFHNNPAAELEVIGFTGTFGKTTTSSVLQQLLNAAGRKTCVVGSLGARFQDTSYEHRGMTTPSPVLLQRALRRMRDAGADTVIMEVTSHALRLDRVHGMRFGGGMLAAIRPGEHIDFHRNYDDYVASKRRLLDYLAPGALLAYDADNRAASAIARERSDVRDVGFSLRRTPIGGEAVDEERREANLRDRRIMSMADARLDDRGALFTIDGVRVRSALLGRGNLRNVALALTFARQVGLPIEDARESLAGLEPLSRRMERYEVAGRTVLDDTAGHPESFDATFEVADLMPANRVVIAYALRGSRGADINYRNALSLADHALSLGAFRTIVTEAADTAGALDRVQADEADAARRAFRDRGLAPAWHETMRAAMEDTAGATRAGDLIVLVGAQGMNAGREHLNSALL